jgi:hypothetical protein
MIVGRKLSVSFFLPSCILVISRLHFIYFLHYLDEDYFLYVVASLGLKCIAGGWQLKQACYLRNCGRFWALPVLF